MAKNCNIAVALLYDDHTWWPETVEIPVSVLMTEDDDFIADWVKKNNTEVVTSKVVRVFIYDKDPAR